MLVDSAHTGMTMGKTNAHMYTCERCETSFAHVHKVTSAIRFMELCDFCLTAKGYRSARIEPAEAARGRDSSSHPRTREGDACDGLRSQSEEEATPTVRHVEAQTTNDTSFKNRVDYNSPSKPDELTSVENVFKGYKNGRDSSL